MKPSPATMNVPSDSEQLRDFMRALTFVPHSELKERLDAERQSKRTSKPSSSNRAPNTKIKRHSLYLACHPGISQPLALHPSAAASTYKA